VSRSSKPSSRSNVTLEPFVAAMARGCTVTEAAEHAGISRSTAHRRLADPKVRQRITEARSATVERAGALLVDSWARAVARLVEFTESPNDTAAVGACKALLDYGLRLREAGELEERIAALERAQREAQSSGALRGVA